MRRTKAFERLVFFSRVKFTTYCLGVAAFAVICNTIVDINGHRDDKLIAYRKRYLDKVVPVIGDLFLILFILLCLSISILIWRLKLKQRQLKACGLPNVFGQEIWNLIIILIIFSISFIVRFVFDEWILVPILKAFGGDSSDFYTYMLCEAVQYLWDFFPIGAIVLFHRHNFGKQQNSVNDNLT